MLRYFLSWVRYCSVTSLIVVTVILAGSLSQQSVAQAASTQARVQIAPTVCVVDVVHDGNEQLLYTSSKDCKSIVPRLLTPVATNSEEQSITLPFVGRDTSSQPIFEDKKDDLAWAPIASTQASGGTSLQSVRMISTVTAGIITVAAATSIAIDMVLFELHYSKQMVRWAKHRIPRAIRPN